MATSNISYNYDSVELLDQSGNIIRSSKIVYSSELKNEFLAMMLAEMDKPEPEVKTNLYDDIGLPIEDLSVLASIGMMQDSDSTPNINSEFYTFIDNCKVTVLRLPKSCTKIRLYESGSENEYIIDLANDQDYLVPMASQVEKLVLLSISQSEQSNYSPKIHENSNSPHSELEDKITMSTKFYDTIALTEVDFDDLYCSKSLVRLGDLLSKYADINEDQSVVCTDPNKSTIMITNRVY